MVNSGHNVYKQNAANAIISKDQLLLKLYNGSLNFLKLAKRGIEEKNPKVSGENISKVIAILTELDCALDMEAGGEIAENLSSLYRHIMYGLVNANLKKDTDAMDKLELLLCEVKEGFEEAIRINKKKPDTTTEYIPDNQEGLQFAV